MSKMTIIKYDLRSTLFLDSLVIVKLFSDSTILTNKVNKTEKINAKKNYKKIFAELKVRKKNFK